MIVFFFTGSISTREVVLVYFARPEGFFWFHVISCFFFCLCIFISWLFSVLGYSSFFLRLWGWLKFFLVDFCILSFGVSLKLLVKSIALVMVLVGFLICIFRTTNDYRGGFTELLTGMFFCLGIGDNHLDSLALMHLFLSIIMFSCFSLIYMRRVLCYWLQSLLCFAGVIESCTLLNCLLTVNSSSYWVRFVISRVYYLDCRPRRYSVYIYCREPLITVYAGISHEYVQILDSACSSFLHFCPPVSFRRGFFLRCLDTP